MLVTKARSSVESRQLTAWRYVLAGRLDRNISGFELLDVISKKNKSPFYAAASGQKLSDLVLMISGQVVTPRSVAKSNLCELSLRAP